VLHQQVVLLSVTNERVPEIPPDKRVTVEDTGQGFYRVSARYGFMQTPNMPNVLLACNEQGLTIVTGLARAFPTRASVEIPGRGSGSPAEHFLRHIA